MARTTNALGTRKSVATVGSSSRLAAKGKSTGEGSEPGEGSKHGDRLAPGLYIVSTPIGNLRDITLRALDVLGAADLVACEDTRVTARLLAAYGLATPTTPYHEHNAARARPRLLRRLAGGAAIALVSDAGTPLVSDPGYRLVREALAAAIPVIPVPGPSAPLAALVAAGLPTDRFLFAGFLPARRAARKATLASLSHQATTLVFLESARRLPASLADMAAVFGAREAAVARELTKLHEELRRGPLADLAAHYAARGAPCGEVVVVVGPPVGCAPTRPDDDIDAMLETALAEMTLRDAVAAVSAATGRTRRDVYARALALKGTTRR